MKSRLPFFIIVTAVLLGICFFTARVYSTGLLADPLLSKKLSVISLLIGILYISSLAIRRNATWLARTATTVLNIVAGIFFYLFLGTFILILSNIVLLLTIHTVPVVSTWIVIGVATTASIIGFIQARIIRVTTYTVSIKNLPPSWQNKKAVLVTDTHFGLLNYKKFSDKVVSKILSLKPDFVLHGGDFYDGPIVNTEPLTASWQKLTEQVPVFYTPGNHEAYGDYVLFVNSVKAAGVTVLDDKMVEYDGVQIAGTLYHGGQESKDVAAALSTMNLDHSKPTILINHPPTSLPEASTEYISLMVSGHTHRGQFWPARYITRRVYHGYDYGMEKYEDMTVITSNGVGTFGPPMRFLNPPEVVVIRFI